MLRVPGAAELSMKATVPALLASLAVSGATAAERCRIADPSAASLGIREFPNGPVVATFRNGQVVRLIDTTVDSRGRGWALVGRLGPSGVINLRGWVIRDHVDCG